MRVVYHLLAIGLHLKMIFQVPTSQELLLINTFQRLKEKKGSKATTLCQELEHLLRILWSPVLGSLHTFCWPSLSANSQQVGGIDSLEEHGKRMSVLKGRRAKRDKKRKAFEKSRVQIEK